MSLFMYVATRGSEASLLAIKKREQTQPECQGYK